MLTSGTCLPFAAHQGGLNARLLLDPLYSQQGCPGLAVFESFTSSLLGDVSTSVVSDRETLASACGLRRLCLL